MASQYAHRADGTQLPSAAELLDILTMESQRHAVHFDFIHKSDAVFAAHRQLSRRAHSDDSWIAQYSNLPLDTLVDKINTNHTALAQYIQTRPTDNQLYTDIYNSLITPDNLSPSQAIFVFGAKSNARVERAIELYNDDVAKMIVISGNSPHYTSDAVSEASRMASYATEHGIPSDHLLIEESSVTLPDNVKRSLDLMESINWHPKSVTIVATNLVLMRAQMEWYKFCPWPIKIRSVSAHPQSAKFTAEGWFNHDDSIALVLNEYAKLILESKIDLMRQSGEIN